MWLYKLGSGRQEAKVKCILSKNDNAVLLRRIFAQGIQPSPTGKQRMAWLR